MIYLFGSTGMLGNYIKNKLNPSFNLSCINRKDFDIFKDNQPQEVEGMINVNYTKLLQYI